MKTFNFSNNKVFEARISDETFKKIILVKFFSEKLKLKLKFQFLK